MKKKAIIVSIVLILFLIFIFSYYSYSFYSSNPTGSDKAIVANFSLSIDENSIYFPYELDSVNSTFKTEYYKFEITNIKNSRISEVKQKYVLAFAVTRNLPFDIELYQVNQDVYDDTTNTTFDSSSATLIKKVEYPNDVNIENTNTFEANVLSKDYYVVKVSWNSKYTSYIYQNKIDLFKINADFEQIS